ncbi:MAG: hypothetical protein EA397_02115 [Deltaproteobacteria bacterium]|nr:MAG: hypothetical protein EA397_02115 [Deltaproteobacteria bacterium]
MTGHDPITAWPQLDLIAWGPRITATWRDGDAVVAVIEAPPLVHAIGTAPFDRTARLLAAHLRELPDRFELRTGPAAAGIVARTHRLTMLGPMQRFVGAQAILAEPVGLRPLGPEDHAAVADLADPHHDFDPAWMDVGGWLAVERQGKLLGAAGPCLRADGVTLISPPRLARAARRDTTGAALLAALLRRHSGVCLDVRMDRRDRVKMALEAGFRSAGAWERWWAEAR